MLTNQHILPLSIKRGRFAAVCLVVQLSLILQENWKSGLVNLTKAFSGWLLNQHLLLLLSLQSDLACGLRCESVSHCFIKQLYYNQTVPLDITLSINPNFSSEWCMTPYLCMCQLETHTSNVTDVKYARHQFLELQLHKFAFMALFNGSWYSLSRSL